jgi:hypothetical protein
MLNDEIKKKNQLKKPKKQPELTYQTHDPGHKTKISQ